jgi:dephospho-CoA kinase
MLKVGITGGIGSGKSAASKRLAELGAYIFDADAEAKKILDENKTVQEQLIQEFGTDIMSPDGSIHRKKLALKAFSNEENQAILNAIVHPFVFDKIDELYEKVKEEDQASIDALSFYLAFF